MICSILNFYLPSTPGNVKINSMNKKIFSLDNLFLASIGTFFTFLSVGFLKNSFIAISIIIIFIFIGAKLIQGINIKIPDNFTIYNLFNITLLIHYYLIGGEIIYFWMFFVGGMFWLSMYNVSETTKKYFPGFLISLGFLMLATFTYYYFKGVHFISPDNLFLPQKEMIKHNHIGDLWALILVLLSYKITTKSKVWQILLSIVALVIITFSLSRSALVSFIVGLIYIFYNLPNNSNDFKLAPKHFWIIFIISLPILVYFGSVKSILFARPYYMEAIRSLFSNPLGLGMGEFAKASTETNVVHNLVLEVVSGIGVFSIVFIYWLYKMAVNIFFKKGSDLLYAAIAVAMFTNFSFDSSYVIPVFFWLWFCVIALI